MSEEASLTLQVQLEPSSLTKGRTVVELGLYTKVALVFLCEGSSLVRDVKEYPNLQSVFEVSYNAVMPLVWAIVENIRRNISDYLKYAFAFTHVPFGSYVLQKEIDYVKEYVQEKSDKYVILFNQKTNQVLPLPYVNRFSVIYQRLVRKRLNDFMRYVLARGLKYSVFVTLTINTKDFITQYQAKRRLEKSLNSLLTRLRAKYPHIAYIRTVEWQNNGIGVHVHLLVFGIGFLSKEWVLKTWSKINRSGWGVELTSLKNDFRNERHALNYIMKYVQKQFRNSPNEDLPLSSIINCALGSRSFSMSRMPVDLVMPLSNSNEKSSSWVFLGVVEAYVLNAGVDAVLEHLFPT